MSDVIFNPDQNRYELTEDGHMATADIRRDGDTVFINLVFAPMELRGKGTASRLMEGIVADAQVKGLTLHPICGYAAKWLDRHSQ